MLRLSILKTGMKSGSEIFSRLQVSRLAVEPWLMRDANAGCGIRPIIPLSFAEPRSPAGRDHAGSQNAAILSVFCFPLPGRQPHRLRLERAVL